MASGADLLCEKPCCALPKETKSGGRALLQLAPFSAAATFLLESQEKGVDTLWVGRKATLSKLFASGDSTLAAFCIGLAPRAPTVQEFKELASSLTPGNLVLSTSSVVGVWESVGNGGGAAGSSREWRRLWRCR